MTGYDADLVEIPVPTRPGETCACYSYAGQRVREDGAACGQPAATARTYRYRLPNGTGFYDMSARSAYCAGHPPTAGVAMGTLSEMAASA